MITLLCLLAAACPPMALFAQNLQMLVDGTTSSQVALENLRVDVKVTGSIASTTWTMIFKNNSNRLLEGELTFPLPEGITVSHYAIDINGKLRNAVPVDKARGTTVLEAIEQRRIDPGLLEQVEGNAFRTRVYPLPAGGTRTVVIGYDEVLQAKGSKLEYRLPLTIKQAIPKVILSIVSTNGGKPEPVRSSVSDMSFDQQGAMWTATKELDNFIADRPLSFQIPQAKEAAVLMQQKDSDSYYCLINTPPRFGSRERRLPNEITVLWDASLSGLSRNHDAELELLDGYLRRVANATINLITFSNSVQPIRSFPIKSGDWHLLRETIENLSYDGGTQLGKLDLHDMPGREFLLFSDGMATYGKGNIITSRAPIYCINSSAHADFASLRFMAAKTGGQVIDLTSLTKLAALEQLTHQPLLLLGIQKDRDIEEVYPNVPVSAENGASITAISHIRNGDITLLYGYGTVIMEERTISFAAKNATAPGIDLGRIWASQKIAALDKSYEQNRPAIEILGKRFGLVTRNTSLIVLENLEDYLRYAVKPPEELREAYDLAVKQRGELHIAAIQNKVSLAENMTVNLLDWWNQSNPAVRSQPLTTVDGTINTATAPEKSAQKHASRAYTAPIIDPENPGSRQVRVEEQIEKVPTRSISDLATLSTQSYPSSAAGLQIGGSRVSGIKYVIDGVHLPAGSMLFSTGGGSTSDKFIDEAAPLFGIGAGRREKRKAKELNETLASIAKTASLSDSVLLDSLFSTYDDQQYQVYLGLRKARMQNSSFYLQVARYFMETGRKETGLRILSNLSELDVENYELFKMLGYKLREVGEKEAALETFRKVAAWRPMDPQSKRDYALALADAGFYQAAMDSLYAALTLQVDPSLQAANIGIEEVLLCDINGLLTQHPDAITPRIPRKIIQPMPSDLRVVINWNTKSTDVNLSVTDPKGEKCYYAHNRTTTGGRLSRNITEGFGPEQYLLRSAASGRYKIEVSYGGDHQVKIAGPTTIMAEVFTGFEKPEQQRQIFVLQLKPDDKGSKLVGEFEFGSRL